MRTTRVWLALGALGLLVCGVVQAQGEFAGGVYVHGDLSRLGVPYDDSLTGGLSLGAGLQGHWYLGKRWRFSPALGYQKLMLSRVINPSGPLASPDPTPVDQALGYLVLQALVGFQVGPTQAGEPVFWLEAGAESLFLPLSAEQSIRGRAPESFENADRPLLGIAGVAAALDLGGQWSLELRAHAVANLAAAQGSNHYGVRLNVALIAGL